MIFVRDKGQMCNNILQYAHVYAWAREHHRHCMSMRFAYKYQYFRICSSRHHNFFYYLAGKLLAEWGIIPTVTFDENMTDLVGAERLILSKPNVMIEGWGVRFFDLFHKYLHEIVALFEFNPSIRQRTNVLLQSAANPALPRIGVHIRRGDYKTWCAGKFYFTDEEYLAYILRAMEELGQSHYNIYMCGNVSIDEDWFRARIGGRAEVFFPHGNPGEDLCVLSECNYLIGPLSSFTLVASMYGKAQLYWMYSHDVSTPIVFAPFERRLPELDTLWGQVFNG